MSEEKPTTKRVSRWKPVWVCVPTEYGEVSVPDDDGSLSVATRPTSYAITKCLGGAGQKKAIVRALAKHEIDPTNYDDVLIFRARPLDHEIDTQLIIRGI